MSDQQQDRPSQQVGEYRLIHKLGTGCFGTVYLAENIHNHTQAAVKVLNISLTKQEDLKNFLNEASTIRLRHPHIVPLLNFGISRDDLPYLVMEYAPQGTLRDRHPKGERIPLSTIVSYIDQLASALQYAHNHRIIHRDVKPENILVRADGTLLISDFGIAKLLEQSVLISRQKVTGTPAYMAPEQHKGYPCFASDQYALAVMIYEWICGVRPFKGTVLGLAAQHMNTPPPSLRNYLPELSEAIEYVVLKALAKAPQDRFESIQSFANALREAIQPITISPSIEANNTIPPIHPEPQSLPDEEASSQTRNNESAQELQEATNQQANLQTIAPLIEPPSPIPPLSHVPHIHTLDLNNQEAPQDRSNQHARSLVASNSTSPRIKSEKPMPSVRKALLPKPLLSLAVIVLGSAIALLTIIPYVIGATQGTSHPTSAQRSSILGTPTPIVPQSSAAQVPTSTPTTAQAAATQAPTPTATATQVSTPIPTSTSSTNKSAPNYRPSGTYTKWRATTSATAPGYIGTQQVGILYGNPNYMFCKAWAGIVTDSSGNYNHWWLWTDLDTGGQGWVSAYYLSKWGDDEAKDDSGNVIPNC